MVFEDSSSEHCIGSTSDSLSSKVFYAGAPTSLQSFDAYDRNKTTPTPTIALAGLGASILFSFFCIISGICIAVLKEDVYTTVLPPYWPQADKIPSLTLFSAMVAILPNSVNSFKPNLLGLVLNLAVTFCTECAGIVHATTLRSTLVTESRLQFNTNIRLLTASRVNPWTNPNGTMFNGVMAILLILSYVSSSLVFLSFQAIIFTDQLEKVSDGRQWNSTCIFAAPVIVLGVVLLLQAIIALAGLRMTTILTWSTSPLDMTAALLSDGRLTTVPGRCMHNLLQADSGTNYSSQKPSERQPSAWQAHSSIKRVVIVLWVIIMACAGWGGIVVALWRGDSLSATNFQTPGVNSWSFFPNSRSNSYTFGPSYGSYIPALSWVMCYLIITVVQGFLTFGLHCSEVMANVMRDEAVWRAATSKAGTKSSNNALVDILTSWPHVLLLIAKPVLHWMFGLSLNVRGTIGYLTSGSTQTKLQMTMHTVQIWYLAIGLLIFSVPCTIIVNHRPHGPQPAAYGHIQTLASLVDEWSPTMWWGHKGGGPLTSHAGTSSHPLPPVNMSYRYAGRET